MTKTKNTPFRDLRRCTLAVALGDDGGRLVAAGVTTPEEVLRVCRG
jgi:type II secretory ATPase GspE/PulE/Tfp pilus assembly ATPase PilB-like protein